MTKRFQRFALIAEAARLESYINKQLDLTYSQMYAFPKDGNVQLYERLQTRYHSLGQCREKANQLRGMIWDLD
jgi:hypothetical protein